MTKKGIDKEIVGGLKSKNQDEVFNTIKKLRESGTSVYIPLLIELMHSSDNPEIKERVFKLLSDLKHTDAIPLIIDAIEDKKYSSDLRELVASCWENGLDFTPYLSIFVDLVINADFMVAFEALTVIENMDGTISSEIKESQIGKINKSIENESGDKKKFLLEILEMINNLNEEVE